MTSITALPPLFKEVRALALPWMACLTCMVVPAIADAPLYLGGFAVPAYFIGAPALGALSIGHEYTGRTLSLLLSLPAERSRLFAIKLAVLAVMQLTLWSLAYMLVLDAAGLPRVTRDTAALLPVLSGVFVAPWLTMLSRSAIGGAVFAVAIPGTLFVIGELMGTWLYGQGAVMEAFRLTFVRLSTLALCLAGAVMGWRAFMRLEVIDGPAAHLNLARLFQGTASAQSATRVTRRHPIGLLVQKELHLQQLPLSVAVGLVLLWTVAGWWTQWAASPAVGQAILALSFLYGGLLPMLIGASASAGERQLGTLEWQVTQPLSTSTQWWIKVGVVLGLSLVLALGVPMLLTYFTDLTRDAATGPFSRRDLWTVMPVMLLASGSLYVSSLSSGALWGLVMSIPAALVGAAFVHFLWFRLGSETYLIAQRQAIKLVAPRHLDATDPFWILNALTSLAIAGFIAVALWFALQNHRSADRSPRRVCLQLLILAAVTTAGVVFVSATKVFLSAMNRLQ